MLKKWVDRWHFWDFYFFQWFESGSQSAKRKKKSRDNGNQFFVNKDSEETRIMYSNSDDIEVVMGKKTDKIIEDRFDYFLQRYSFVLSCSRRWNK